MLNKLFLLFFLSIFSSIILADQASDMAEIQKKLNAEVMEKPFSVEDEEKIDSYIKTAMQKDLKPVEKAPAFWKPGYTCASIYSYGWNHYSSCRYYRHYYGRYW